VWILVAMAALALLPFPATQMIRSAPAALPALALAACAFALVGAGAAAAGRSRHAPAILVLLMGTALMAGTLLIPSAWAEERSTRALVLEAGRPEPGTPLYLHRILAPSLGFYSGRIPTYVPARYLLVSLVDDGRPASIVLEERRDRTVRELLALGFQVRSRSGGRILMRRSEVLAPLD
jgi:hypothetical protein